MNLKTIRRYNTDIQIITFGNEIRLEPTVGFIGKREDIRNMFGTPKINEITALRYNMSFFNTGDPKSEELGVGRGDCFVNVAYDGSKLYFEPDIPPVGMLWEAPSAYMLIRNGKKDIIGELPLKNVTGANPRTMFGQSASGVIYVMIGNGRKIGQKGLTSEEQRDVCQELGLLNAINCDGGGSSVAFIYDKQVGNSWDGRLLGRIMVGYVKYKLHDLPVVKYRSKGVYVNLLQRLLEITADGDFGKMTKTAVEAFQAAHRLEVDGVVGIDTWKVLISVKGAA